MGWRIRHWLAAALGVIILALAAVLYTPPGLAWIARLAGPLSGGTVRVEGLGGFFPNHLHAARLEIADDKGVWLQIEQASLDWSALALLGNRVSVREVEARHITVLRRPLPPSKAGGKTPELNIDHVALPRIELAAPVIGHAVTLSASGSLHYISSDRLEADLLVLRAASRDSYRIAGGIAGNPSETRIWRTSARFWASSAPAVVTCACRWS